MTLIEFEGFETLDPASLIARGFTIANGSGNTSLAAVTNGRYGGRTAYTGGNQAFSFTKPIGATPTDLYFGCASYNTVAVPNTIFLPLFRALNGTNLMGQLTVDVSRNLLAQSRAGTTIGATLGVLPYAQWNWIEAHFHEGTTSGNGTWEVYVNGVLWGTRTGDLGGGTYAGADRFSWGTGFPSAYLDDLYVCDSSGSLNNTYLGEFREIALLPTGAGAHTDFTPSTGSNYQCVDEVPPNGDTDYVASLTPGHLDSYVYQDLPAPTNRVLAVAPRLWARKDDAATRQIADLAVIGGVDYAGSVAQTLTASYVQYQQIHEASPATGVAWTPTEVNGAEFGIDLVA